MNKQQFKSSYRETRMRPNVYSSKIALYAYFDPLDPLESWFLGPQEYLKVRLNRYKERDRIYIVPQYPPRLP